MKSKQSLFSRDFWLIAAVNFIVMTAYYGLMVTTAQYAADRMHAGAGVAGLVTGVTVLGILVARFSSGYLTQRFSTKTLLVAGAILLVPATFAYNYAASITALLLVRVVHGLAIGLISTVTNTAVILLFPPARKGEGIGYFSLSTILATAVGPFLGLLLMGMGARMLFTAVSVSAVLVLLTALLIDARRIRFSASAVREPLTVQSFIEPKALPVASAVFLIGLSYAAIQTYVSLFAKSLHISAWASYFFLIYAVVIIVSRPFTGRVLDRRSENMVMVPAAIVEVVGLIVLAAARNGIAFLIAAALIGAGFGNFQSAAQTVVAKIVPVARLSQATATYFIVFDLSLGVGPFFLGLLVPSIGYVRLFLLCALLSFAGLGVYFGLHGRKVRSYVSIATDETE